jgi:hypothetical protein
MRLIFQLPLTANLMIRRSRPGAAVHARLLSGIESRAQAGRGARQIAAGSNNPAGRYPAPGVIGDGIL